MGGFGMPKHVSLPFGISTVLMLTALAACQPRLDYPATPTTNSYTEINASGLAAIRPYPNPDDVCVIIKTPEALADSGKFAALLGVLRAHPGEKALVFSQFLEALDLCERFAKSLREAVGMKADLLFGTHGQMTAAGAIRLAKRLEPYDPLWLEEPVPPDAPEEMAKVARATSIPVATGERLTTKYDFARLLRAGAAAILQMNLGRVGGILEAKKIAAMAEVDHVQIAPHLYCGPIVGAANIQIATCSPNFLILESIETWGGFHTEILKSPIRFEEGHVIPSTAPGLGVELNEDVARANPYTGNMLHLEMTQHPVQ
jgi:2-dehydro-3-deoxyphosphogalactonate aldolase